MRSDIALGLVTFLMAVLGGIVSAHAPQKNWQKAAYVLAFIVLGSVGLYFVVRQSNETAVAAAGLSRAITDIDNSTKENTRINTLNTDLQKQLLTQNGNLSSMARKSLDMVTGGNSFAQITPIANTPESVGGVQVMIENVGTGWLRNIEFRPLEGSPPFHFSETERAAMFNGAGTLHAGDIAPGQGILVPASTILLHPRKGKENPFHFNFSASNGQTEEDLLVRYNESAKAWEFSLLVSRKNKTIHKENWHSGPVGFTGFKQ